MPDFKGVSGSEKQGEYSVLLQLLTANGFLHEQQMTRGKLIFSKDPRWINTEGNDSKCYQTHRRED